MDPRLNYFLVLVKLKFYINKVDKLYFNVTLELQMLSIWDLSYFNHQSKLELILPNTQQANSDKSKQMTPVAWWETINILLKNALSFKKHVQGLGIYIQ